MLKIAWDSIFLITTVRCTRTDFHKTERLFPQNRGRRKKSMVNRFMIELRRNSPLTRDVDSQVISKSSECLEISTSVSMRLETLLDTSKIVEYHWITLSTSITYPSERLLIITKCVNISLALELVTLSTDSSEDLIMMTKINQILSPLTWRCVQMFSSKPSLQLSTTTTI